MMNLIAPIIETKDIKKTYMLGKIPVYALRGANLKVVKGETLTILGPSGSGKSTLLNMIGALDKPTEGEVFIGGVNISTLNDNGLAHLRRRIGFVCARRDRYFKSIGHEESNSVNNILE